MPKTPDQPTPKAKKRPLKYPTTEHPEDSGIKIIEMPNKTGGQQYGVYYRVRIPAALLGRVGKREVYQFKTKAEALKLAEDRYVALRKHGTSFAELSPTNQKQAIIAWGILKEHEIDFVEAAEAAVRVLRPVGGNRTFAQVLTELRDSKAQRLASGGLDKRTYDDFRSRSLKIEAALGAKQVSLITADEVAAWLRTLRTKGIAPDMKPLSQRSVLNYRNVLNESFSYAKAKKYCPESPLENFSREEYKSLGGEKQERDVDAIGILTVENASKLLSEASARSEMGLLPGLALRLFCGLRTTEVARLDWSEVRWLEAKPFVHIPAGKAKKRRIRLVDIPENAVAWLKQCNPPKTGRVVPGSGTVKNYCKHLSRLAKLAAVKMSNNDTRHSFGSYHYALHGDAVRTSTQMGHKQGDDTLFSHYRQLVTKETAEAYFGLRPTASDAKVTAFPQAATA